MFNNELTTLYKYGKIMKFFVVIFLLLFATSCNISQKKVSKNLALINESKNIAQDKIKDQEESILEINKKISSTQKDCNCFNRIGSTAVDDPVLISHFSNGTSTFTCGFYDNEMREEGLIISEFNIFECESGNKLVEFEAVQICKLKESKDLITIALLKYLPSRTDWEWELIQTGEQVVYLENGHLVASELKPKFQKIVIEKARQKCFLKTISKGIGTGDNWEEELAKLELLSLIGNKRAWKILKNYEAFIKGQTNGALAEQ